MKKKEKNIPVTNQTFEQAGGVANFGKLEMLGNISLTPEEFGDDLEIAIATTLAQKAKEKLGANYLFDYRFKKGGILEFKDTKMHRVPHYFATAYKKMPWYKKLFKL